VIPNRRTILSTLLSLPLVSHLGFAADTEKPTAFAVGEKLSYSLGWQFSVAGHATIEVLPDEAIAGRKVRSFMMTAKTNTATDRIFKVRDELSSQAEYDVSRSLGYSKIQREGKTKRDVSVEFDVGSVIKGPMTDGKRCKVAEIRVVSRERIKVNGKKYDTFKMVPDIKDVGGVFEKSKNAKIELWCTADHRHIPVRMKSKVLVGNFKAELES
jgi:hypothetical protein